MHIYVLMRARTFHGQDILGDLLRLVVRDFQQVLDGGMLVGHLRCIENDLHSHGTCLAAIRPFREHSLRQPCA